VELQEDTKASKAELMITALQQRIGELSSAYELQSATFRAEITMLMDENKQLKEQLEGGKG
jgi:hypothetical protein